MSKDEDDASSDCTRVKLMAFNNTWLTPRIRERLQPEPFRRQYSGGEEHADSVAASRKIRDFIAIHADGQIARPVGRLLLCRNLAIHFRLRIRIDPAVNL